MISDNRGVPLPPSALSLCTFEQLYARWDVLTRACRPDLAREVYDEMLARITRRARRMLSDALVERYLSMRW